MATIKEFLSRDNQSTEILTIKMIKEIDATSYVIADKSSLALLDISMQPSHGRLLKPGYWYKLIKCKRADNMTVRINERFKPIKLSVKQELKIDQKKIEKFEESLKTTAKLKKYENLENISKRPNHSKVETLTVKIIKISRIIETSRGSYQICTIKDHTGNSASLNLYAEYMDRLELFQVYIFKNLRKAEIVKKDEVAMRLHTTSFTKIENCTTEDSLNFQNVGNGSETLMGQIIGCGEFVTYKSCNLHYKKIYEELNCPRCESKVKEENVAKDFRIEMYIQVSKKEGDDQEMDVKEVLMFKRVLGSLLQCYEDEEEMEDKVNQLSGMDVKIDYNVDDAGRLIAVSIQNVTS